VYRDTAGRRSAQRVAEQLSKSFQLMHRWQSRWDWKARATAWDGEQDREYCAEVLRSRARIGRQHAHGAQAMRDIAVKAFQTINAATMSPRDALEYMKQGLAIETVLYGLDEHGKTLRRACRSTSTRR